jgi:hypothetical protein
MYVCYNSHEQLMQGEQQLQSNEVEVRHRLFPPYLTVAEREMRMLPSLTIEVSTLQYSRHSYYNFDFCLCVLVLQS